MSNLNCDRLKVTTTLDVAHDFKLCDIQIFCENTISDRMWDHKRDSDTCNKRLEIKIRDLAHCLVTLFA